MWECARFFLFISASGMLCQPGWSPHPHTGGGVILTDRKIPSGEAQAQEEREKGSGIFIEAEGNVLGHNLTAGCKATGTGQVFGRAWEIFITMTGNAFGHLWEPSSGVALPPPLTREMCHCKVLLRRHALYLRRRAEKCYFSRRVGLGAPGSEPAAHQENCRANARDG